MSALLSTSLAAKAALDAASDADGFALFAERAPAGRTWYESPGVVFGYGDEFAGEGGDRDGDARAVVVEARCYGPVSEAVRLAGLVDAALLSADVPSGITAELVSNLSIPNRDPSVRYAGRRVAVRYSLITAR